MKKEECNTDKAEKLIEQIAPIMEKLCVDCRRNFASILIGEIVIWGTENLYEALGMLEDAKVEYRRGWENAMKDEDDNNDNEETNETKKIIKL